MKALLIATAFLAIVSSAAAEFSHSGSEFSNSGSDNSESNKGTPVPTPQPTVLPNCKVENFNAAQKISLIEYAIQGPVLVAVANASDMYSVSPCATAAITNCSSVANAVGYAALLVDGQCSPDNIYTVLHSAVSFGESSQSFAMNVKTADLQKSLKIVVHCDKEQDGTVGVAAVNANNADEVTLTIGSYKVCPHIDQPLMQVNLDSSCAVDFDKYDHTFKASLRNFSGTPKTINDEPAVISPCGGQTDFSTSAGLTACPSTPGYMAFMAGSKCVVLTEREATFNPNTLAFNTTFSRIPPATAAPQMFGADMSGDNRRVIIVKCGDKDSTDGEVSTGDNGETVITYTSTEACGDETAPTPAAPAEPNGLSTGAIVGIVIGSLALIVIILVVCRWRSSKGEEELGEYERV